MKKSFILAFFNLWLVATYAQIPIAQQQIGISANDGTYLFEKAELFLRNDATKEIIEHKVITDTAAINPRDLHLRNTLLKLSLSNGRLNEVILSDRQKYTMDDMMMLKLVKDDKNELPAQKGENELQLQTESEKLSTREGEVLPPYNVKSEGENLVISFAPYPFGQTNYKFTLEAELVVTLTKQKDNEKDAI